MSWKRLAWLAAGLCGLMLAVHFLGAPKALFLCLFAAFLYAGERPRWSWRSAPDQAHLAENLRQLAFMTRLGVPLLRALEVQARHAEQPELRRIWSQLGAAVAGGRTLSAAMSARGDLFPRSLIGMIAAGELTGALVQNLDKVAEMLAREAKLKKKVVASLTYPALVLGLILVLSLFTLLVIFPGFAESFRHMNVPLPLLTRLLMLATSWVTSPTAWLLAVGLAKIGYMQFRQGYASPGSRRAACSWLLKLPVFGPILRYSSLTRYCWAFE
ncbi:MAG: type II secretion system F family protein, partial [Candidatus Eremiobacteraeota bacterium]|nr:type II secretion system F family protein [Candidatus Eremiobacteraeota bacterium]